MSTAGLAIFVKTPGLSPVKSRLAPGLGQPCAEEFHLASAAAVASVVQSAKLCTLLQPYWAVAENEAMSSGHWTDLPRLAQGDGSLGERMRQIYGELLQRHAAAVLIGSDSPQLTSASLLRAVVWLAGPAPRIALGPANDGGFWLFGGNCELALDAWTSVTYSTSNTSRDFLAQMGAHAECLELELLTDVDHYADFLQVARDLAALPTPTDAQTKLRKWMYSIVAQNGACS